MRQLWYSVIDCASRQCYQRRVVLVSLNKDIDGLPIKVKGCLGFACQLHDSLWPADPAFDLQLALNRRTKGEQVHDLARGLVPHVWSLSVVPANVPRQS
jgi:hypothetical protein